MNASVTRDGLSARQRTIPYFTFFFMLMLLFPAACQHRSPGQLQAGNSVAKQDSTSKPDVRIQVNKRYDDKGNLTGFDSLYTSYYSGSGINAADSILRGFGSYPGHQHFLFRDPFMNPFFFSDSLRIPDLFRADFFRYPSGFHDPNSQRMFQQMDSVRNHIYRNYRANKDHLQKIL